MSICVISQPRLFPGLHYLHRMMVADVFVIFDTVQFNPRHEENRAKVKTPNGAQWLTVPMKQSRREQPIRDTRVDQTQPWQRRATGILHDLYRTSPFYRAFAPEVFAILEGQHETLTQLDRASWEPALRLLGITCRFVSASELPVSGRGPRLLVDVCQYVGATTYLSGAFGRDYLDVAEFSAVGIDVKFHDYRYPAYPQLYGDFVPFLSYLDVLFNVGLNRDTISVGGKMLPPRVDAGGAPVVVGLVGG
jgi:hypothetical protein